MKKYIFILLAGFLSFGLSAQKNNDISKELDKIDIDKELDHAFKMIDSLQIEFGDLSKFSDMIKEGFGTIGEDKEMFKDLMEESFKAIEKIDIKEMENMMEGFMKEFESMNFDELFDVEKIEKIVDDREKKRRKI